VPGQAGLPVRAAVDDEARGRGARRHGVDPQRRLALTNPESGPQRARHLNVLVIHNVWGNHRQHSVALACALPPVLPPDQRHEHAVNHKDRTASLRRPARRLCPHTPPGMHLTVPSRRAPCSAFLQQQGSRQTSGHALLNVAAWRVCSLCRGKPASFRMQSTEAATPAPVVRGRRVCVLGVLRDRLGVAAPVEGEVEAARGLGVLLHARDLEVPGPLATAAWPPPQHIVTQRLCQLQR